MSAAKKRTLYEKKRRLRFAESISDLERALIDIGIPSERLHSQLDIINEANDLLGRAKETLKSVVANDAREISLSPVYPSQTTAPYTRTEEGHLNHTSPREVFAPPSLNELQ